MRIIESCKGQHVYCVHCTGYMIKAEIHQCSRGFLEDPKESINQLTCMNAKIKRGRGEEGFYSQHTSRFSYVERGSVRYWYS